MPRARIPIAVLAAGTMLVVAGVVAGFVVAGRSGGDDRRTDNVAVVWGNPIPRSLFSKGMAVRIASIRAQTGDAPHTGTPAYRRVQDQTMRQIVSDVTVVAEARRLGLVTFNGLVVAHIVSEPAQTPAIWNRVYNFAARAVREPGDPKVVRATTFDADALPDLLTSKQLREYYAWQTRRDRVASAWFGRLFRRYRAHTTYAPGFRPSAP